MTRSTMRAIVLALVPVGLLALGAGVASAQTTSAVVRTAESDSVTFGLWGPVGLAAVVLGVIGMAAGVVRQRRNVRAASTADTDQPTGDVTAMTETVLPEPPTRPQLSPVPRA
ncbi:hypothetical protein [Amycolatopsis sp.]|uniref:hypothetical protein n=1 Tax=Amycolatopsis sp. TaxID=37632 RepID=UPI0026267369|nr:hypothetical protein [Amycolatopsis sp.]